jgi:hypothetical protein
MTEFKNPWLGDPNHSRSTLIVPTRVISEIKRIEPKDGAVQTTVSILTDKFLYELTKLNLLTADRASYHAAVLNARIVLCDSTGKPFGEPTRPIESGSTVTKPPIGRKSTRTRKTTR